MYGTSTGHTFILAVSDEVKIYIVTIPPIFFHFCGSPSIFIKCYAIHLKRLDIEIKTISPHSHSSLKTEIHIRTISEILAKQLTGTD